ncbi:D-serine ammonia-lyase dsd1, partial [Ascosphaera atra]
MVEAVSTGADVPSQNAANKKGSIVATDDKFEKDKVMDFYWADSEEPHRRRRMAIIKAHPEVLKLCGPEPLTKWVVAGVVLTQFVCGFLLRNTPILSWKFFLTAYIIGATCNQNLFMAIHEISHNLASKKPFENRLLAIFANLPIGIPYSAAFR